MRRSAIFSLKSTLIALAVVAAGAFLFVNAPRAPKRLETSGWNDLASRTVPGAYHIHTTRSDGHGDRSQIAAAAARAGLAFIILTDHGDGTRPPDPPAYLDGVLVLDGVEISTDDGHYVAIDMPRAPYPLGGTGESVEEDVRRLGGFGVLAHPDSPKPALRWTSNAPGGGIEWLNLDSEWRDKSRARLLRTGAAYIIRPAPALTMILSRPATLDARWPALLLTRPTVALAAADAHGGVGRRVEDASGSLAGNIGIPSYEASFRTFSNRLILERALTGDAAADARAVYAAIRSGRVFTSIDALAAPALLDYSFEGGFSRAEMGSVLDADTDGTLLARANAPSGSVMSILRNAKVVASGTGGEVRYVVSGARGCYRVEIVAPGTSALPPIPWVVGNCIYFGAKGGEGAKGAEGAGAKSAEGAAIAPFPWRIESDASSKGILRTGAHSASLEYTLGDGLRGGQFVAMATDVHDQRYTVLDLSLRGERPLRVSVQVRSADGRRWGRSYYVDPAGSSVAVRLADLKAVAGAAEHTPTARDVASILLVVDLTNAAPGSSGVLTVNSSALR